MFYLLLNKNQYEYILQTALPRYGIKVLEIDSNYLLNLRNWMLCLYIMSIMKDLT